MNICRQSLAALVVLLALASLATAQKQENLTKRITRHTTAWVDVPTTNELVDVGSVSLPTGGTVFASLEFRYAYEAENLFGPAITSYQVGSGFEFHIGPEGRQICSNSCGGALAQGDGINWQPPQPWPSTMVGYEPNSDHHYVPHLLAFASNLGHFSPGQHPIRFAAYQVPQQWGDVLNPTYPSHFWEVKSCYLQMRVVLLVAHAGAAPPAPAAT